MTNEEASARKGLGVQSVDETLKGTLASTHGDYALIRLDNGSIVWLECSKLKEWDAPAPEHAQAEAAVTDQEPVQQQAAEAEEPATRTDAGDTMQSEGTRVAIPQEVATPKPAANPFADRALNKEEAIVSAKTLVPSIEWDQDGNGGLAYAVGQFGWTVLYQGKLCRVIMVFSDGTMGIDVDGRNLILPIDSPELS